MTLPLNTILNGDCLEVMKDWPDDSADLVFCSPPYEDARTYGIDFNLKGQDWVDWALPRFVECVRVCKGLVCWVVEGKTKQYRWSATPALLMADLHRAGVSLRKPPAFHRVGISGSGGPDWLRNDYEFIICATSGRLPWSDNVAMGMPCKYPVGGEMSYRNKNGERKNASESQRRKGIKGHTVAYNPPKIANPGNIIRCRVGGGVDNKISHENEAPFPEKLAEFFIRSFCPPNGVVVDCYSGSGTTVSAAKQLGRRWIAIDIRKSQCELTARRLKAVQMPLWR